MRNFRKSPEFSAVKEAFESRYMPEPMSGCWLWTGPIWSDRGPKSYGTFIYNKAGIRGMRAHRASWLIYKGPIVGGLHILHRCDNTFCVNPEHLKLGTHQQNMQDMKLKGRAPRDERSGVSTISTETVEFIKSSDRPQVELAKQFGIAASTVSNIKRGWRRGHIKV